MRNKCVNCAKKLLEHIWLLISWFINAVCGIISFNYRNDSEKTATIIFVEKLLISLSNLFAMLNVPICCKKAINIKNEDPIEEGKKLLSLMNVSEDIINKLRELAANKNKDAEELLKNLNSAGQTMINKLILIKK